MRFLLFSLLLLASGCHHRFPLPYTVNQLAADSAHWPGEGLVHYLAQQNADVSVCSLTPPPVLSRTDEDLVEPFVAALEEQKLSPERWQACATRLVPGLPPASQELTWTRLSRVIFSLLDVAESAPRLIAAHEVLAERPLGHSPALESLMGRLLEFNRERLAPALVPVFDTLVSTLELGHGQLAGHTLTESDITNTQDEALLGRMSLRLPEASLRAAARRKLIHLRIERSEFSEVKSRAAEVEAAVMDTGRWAQPISTLELQKPELPLALSYVALVRQDVEAQQVTLLAEGDELAPALDLHGVVHFSVGWSRPLSLCQPATAIGVEPCIDAREVEVANPTVSFDAEGMLRLPERLTMGQAMELARADEGVVLPIRIGGQLVTSLQVPLRFETPSAIRFEADTGERGPAVNVVVQPVASSLLFSATSETGVQRMAVYPRAVSSSFEVASVGGRGATGQTGYTGAAGQRGDNGANALCPAQSAQEGGQGGDGGRGGDGGQGGNGGPGGFVSVVLQCGGPCPADEQWVRQLVQSRGGEGGAGGSGGSGGSGGEGGSGGSGTSCQVNGATEALPSASSGSRGRDGQSGSTGWRGSDGANGQVQLQVQ